jgi:hypothetical protein
MRDHSYVEPIVGKADVKAMADSPQLAAKRCCSA